MQYSNASLTLGKIHSSTFSILFYVKKAVSNDQFSQYLESLCDYLYDDLRPRILHEPRLSVLCGVCRVLQALMVLDVPEIEAEAESDDEDRSSNSQVPTYKVRQGLGKLHISHLLRGVLQDAQTRLFFKAQTVIQAEIRYYVPKTEDLDYPEKLIGMEFVHLDRMSSM